MLIIFWEFLMIEQIVPSPQVNQIMIISNKLVWVSSQVAKQLNNNSKLVN